MEGFADILSETKYNLSQVEPPKLNTCIETMTNNDTTAISNLDHEFKQLLSEYTRLLNYVNREIAQKQERTGTMSEFLGKRLKTNNQDLYVNEYGYARTIPLSDDIMDESCPKSSDIFKNSCQGLSDAYGVTDTTDDDTTNFGCAPEFAKDWWRHHSCKTSPASSKHPGCDINTPTFKIGTNMNPGEPCNLAGKNIRNSKTNEVAWVDFAGIKHVYPNQQMRDTLVGCPSKVTITLIDSKYSNVASGSPMTPDSMCLHISVDEQDYSRLLQMNNRLQVLASKIVTGLDALINNDAEMETDIRSKKGQLHQFLSTLKHERINFDKNNKLLKDMKYLSDESHVSYVSNNYHMIAWGLLVAGVGGFTIHQLSTKGSL